MAQGTVFDGGELGSYKEGIEESNGRKCSITTTAAKSSLSDRDTAFDTQISTSCPAHSKTAKTAYSSRTPNAPVERPERFPMVEARF